MKNNNYEIILIFNIINENQYKKVINKYLSIINNNNVKINRIENWGRRELAYSIKKINKAYYTLLNIECNTLFIKELKNNFRLNNLIIRNLILKKEKPINEPSLIMNKINKNS